MVFLIDGYNVLHAVGRGTDPTGRERDRFIELVANYARTRGHQATIIFDGGSSARPCQTAKNGVLIIESGYHHSADDLLRTKMLAYPPEMVMMASSDRAITDDAESHGICSIDADAFYQLVLPGVLDRVKKEPLRAPLKKLEKTRANQGEKTELDLLMEKACRVVHPKKVDLEDDLVDQKKGKKKSKAEKRLERVIKKL